MSAQPGAEQMLALVDHWRAELRELGRRPRWRGRGHDVRRYRARIAPWIERETAIAGALELVHAMQRQAQASAAASVPADAPIDERAVRLRSAGLTFAAVASTLHVPVGTAKTWVRRSRLAAGGAA